MDQNFLTMTSRYGPWSGWNPWFFFLTKISYFGKFINDNDIKIFGFSHQIMQLKILTYYIKDQEILICLGIFIIVMNEDVEAKHRDPYSNCKDMI